MQERRVRRVFIVRGLGRRPITLADEQRESLAWTTRRGASGLMPQGRGWLTVSKPLELPEPDTSWMSDPLLREHCTDWLNKK